MKCIAAVVMMAFVACSSASVSPLLYNAPLAYHAAPLAYATPAITQYSSIPESKLIATPLAAPAPILAYNAAPLIHSAPLAYHAPAPLAYSTKVIAAPVAPIAYTAIQGEARYTALNRGALHEAPLPGHTLSQTSLNLAPAAK